MKQVFSRNGLKVSVQFLPAERAIQQANSGMNDGDGPRVAGLETQYTDLIQVPEKFLDMEFVGFSKNAAIRTDRWESLKPYRIGFIRGWKILEANIVGTQSLDIAGNTENLFNLLKKDRIDIAVIGKAEGLNHIMEQRIKDIRVLSPPLAKKEMFLYLHKKHENLVPKIAASLKDMKREGKYSQIADPVPGNQE
jgi:polar amino acid transport system substrate-binding protein